jgi:hypothetical protein
MSGKLSMKIDEVRIQGTPVVTFIKRLAALKADLEAKGCEVSITIAGEPYESVLTEKALAEFQEAQNDRDIE